MGKGWDPPLPPSQTLLGVRGTQGPFNAKLMGMLGVGGGKGSWGFDSERVGLGGDSPTMQNVLGSGARAANRMGVGLCAGVGRINVTLRSQCRCKETRQLNSSATPHPSSHRCPSQLFPFKSLNWFEQKN